jgi:hypothetical protein
MPRFSVAPTVAKSATVQASAKTAVVDLDKLSYAVAMHETHNCADDTNFTRVNNCHGIIKNGAPERFNSQEESHARFKEIWINGYSGEYPLIAHAKVYSGNDRAETWLKNVHYYLNQ